MAPSITGIITFSVIGLLCPLSSEHTISFLLSVSFTSLLVPSLSFSFVVLSDVVSLYIATTLLLSEYFISTFTFPTPSILPNISSNLFSKSS